MKKIIISSVSIFFVLAICVTALVMGLVSVGFDKDIKKPYQIYISSANTQELPDKMLILRDREEKDLIKINNTYNYFSNGFSTKALSALFSGELNGNISTSYDRISKQIPKNYDSATKITVIFEYKESQELIKDDTIKYNYKYLFFEIDNSSERKEIALGVNEVLSESEENLSYKYSFIGKANLNPLYNYIYNLIA